MEITLIRHGKSRWTENHRMRYNEFARWVEGYNNTGVVEEDNYPAETVQKMINARVVVTSDLKRSIESAKILKPNAKIIMNAIFRETELPLMARTGILRFPPNVWAVILRCLWMIGFSNKCESFHEAKKRAEKAAQLLVDYAKNNERVVLVGHGFFNRLIANELTKRGWKGERKTSSKHWINVTYTWSYAELTE
ncbi:histidine phosphatase family protein [Domibacillus epiphyticus]|uniref:Histidine phosphatase family protein n=1 Tax=Domibacillus epiphyticus TaxID=1714355 RepID=A0A1V2AAC0_9BACI|nr:histidine phosphatase family protein [Domibacillus epiphyticus]OMP67890.1 histidine phosphatase family protein [Domibacillus epiphyticus]